MPAIIPPVCGAVFEQPDITAMSMALDDVCKALNVEQSWAREKIAVRIIEFARGGERSPTKLRDRALSEASGGNTGL